MKLSIVTTLYRSAATIEEFYRRSIKAAEQVAGDIELVIVNDGSPDNSLDLALELHKRDPRVIVVDLSRNFGHHKALMTGLAHASGDLVFLIDSDLEEQPRGLGSPIPTLLAKRLRRRIRGTADTARRLPQEVCRERFSSACSTSSAIIPFPGMSSPLA